MKPISAKLQGKRIDDVLIRENTESRGPRHQLILCFEDGTSFEFWADDSFHPAGGVDPDSKEEIESRNNGMRTVASISIDCQQSQMNLDTRALVRLINEIVYIQECLADDLVAEARRSFPCAFECLEQMACPEFMEARISKILSDASTSVGLHGRDLLACRRFLQTLRRRLANQLALAQNEEVPYSLDFYPLFSEADQAGQ